METDRKRNTTAGQLISRNKIMPYEVTRTTDGKVLLYYQLKKEADEACERLNKRNDVYEVVEKNNNNDNENTKNKNQSDLQS